MFQYCRELPRHTVQSSNQAYILIYLKLRSLIATPISLFMHETVKRCTIQTARRHLACMHWHGSKARVGAHMADAELISLLLRNRKVSQIYFRFLAEEGAGGRPAYLLSFITPSSNLHNFSSTIFRCSPLSSFLHYGRLILPHEFSELVSTALESVHDYGLIAPGGGDWNQRIHLNDTPILAYRHETKSKKTNQSYRNVNQESLGATFPTSTDSSITNSTSYRTSSYTNPAPPMLIISPPAPNPFPRPIVSASMSTIDLSVASCLPLSMGPSGCGGTFSSKSLPSDRGEETALPSSAVTPSVIQPSTSANHRPRRLALLAKLKRQLSKPDIVSNSAPGAKRVGGGSHAERRRARSFSSGPALRNRTSCNAPMPAQSGHMLTSLARTASNFDVPVSENVSIMASDISAPHRRSYQKRRSRRRSSGSAGSLSPTTSTSFHSYSHDYARSTSTLSAAWAYSSENRRSADSANDHIPSIIGSAASFFAAVNRGKDGRTARRGSELQGDHEQPNLPISGERFDDSFVFELKRKIPENATLVSTVADSNDGTPQRDVSANPKVDGQSTQSYMPYLPLALQLERNQQGLKTRVSVEDIVSLDPLRLQSKSRTSLVSSSASREHELHNQSTPHVKTRKHVPPPLQATRTTLPASIMHPYAVAAPQPYSPASTASSRSPITPSTPFFTASEASLEEGESDDQSRIISITESQRLRVEESTLGKAPDIRLSSSELGQTVLQNKSTTIRVHVLPPTPANPDVIPHHNNANITQHQITCQTSYATSIHNTASINIIDVDSGTEAGEQMYLHKQRIRSSSKTHKSPPMSPPPSGPLPTPPASSPSSSIKRRKIGSGANQRSLSPFRHPESTPRMDTLSLTRTVSRESRFWDDEDDEVEEVVSRGDSSFVSVPSSPNQGFSGSESSTGHSDYASFALDALSIRTYRSTEPFPATKVQAIPYANTFGGLYYPPARDVIGFGRQQITAETTVPDRASTREVDMEWTLGLGKPSSLASTRRFPVYSLDAVLLQQSEPTNTTRRVQTTSLETQDERFAQSAAAAVKARERTKSESALKTGSKKQVSANEDWTLSLPLPGPPKVAPQNTNFLSPFKVTKMPPEPELDVRSIQDSIVEDVMSISDYDSILELGPRVSKPSLEVEQVVICVPRIVTTGSGIENGSRSKAAKTCPQPTVFEASEEDDESILETTDPVVKENLAQLDALSADLARFNELLRIGGTELRQSKSSRYGHASDLHSNVFLTVPKSGRSRLRHARSTGVLDIDEPPPKNAILRTASFGNIFNESDATTGANAKDDSSILSLEVAPSPAFAFQTPLIDNSPILPYSEMYRLASSDPSGKSSRPFTSSSSIALVETMETVSGRKNSSSSVDRMDTSRTSSTVAASATACMDDVVISTVSNCYSDLEINPSNDCWTVEDDCYSDSLHVLPTSGLTDASLSQSPVLSNSTTPTKSNYRSLTISTSRPSPPSSSGQARRMSISSVSSGKSGQSSSSLTPTLSPGDDSSRYPTPLNSTLSAPPPSHPTVSLFGEVHPVSSKSRADSLSSMTPERTREPLSASPSPKGTVPSLEDRIRRLRELGVDAGTGRKSRIGLSAGSGNTQTEKGQEPAEIDGVSTRSKEFYTARSSFTSTR